jgi:hypothetical protein
MMRAAFRVQTLNCVKRAIGNIVTHHEYIILGLNWP